MIKMKMKKSKSNIYIIILLFILYFVNSKYNFIILPDKEDIVDYQFNLFTVSTVFAGFSFTVLSLLLGLNSEKTIEKLQGTSLMCRNGEKIFKSVIYFCSSCFISLLFVLRINEFIEKIFQSLKWKFDISLFLFISCITFLVLGIVYFLKSMNVVLQIVFKIYGYNDKQYKEKRGVLDEWIKRNNR